MANGNRPGLAVGTYPTSGLPANGLTNQPSTPPPPRGPNVTGGEGQHGALKGNAARVAALPGGMTPVQVRAMQQFLNNHGFEVAQDGVFGQLTKSAAAAFRHNHKGGAAWSAANGLGVHPAARPTAAAAGSRSSTSAAGRTVGAPDATTGPDPIQTLLQSLLAGGGNVGRGYDPTGFGNAAAAPDVAQAAALARQVAANPGQEAQNQEDISSWYGLDPNASSYKLSVLGRLAQAKAADASAATDTEGNMGDLAKALAGSIGGAANDGSGSVLAAGQNSAGTVAALGQAQSDYESNMDPLLRAEAVGAASREKAANSQTLMDLQDKLGLARGQEAADRATGVMAAVDKNNSLAQQRFANQGNLISTLAQMRAADPSANTLDNAKTRAQIAEINAQAAKARAAAQHLVTGASTAKPKSVNLGDMVASLTNQIGIGPDHRLPANMSLGGVAHLIGTQLQAAGIPKSDPRYQRIAQSIIGQWLDPNGNRLNVPSSWFGPNTQ